jgi:SAM-dependent methyltransferase
MDLADVRLKWEKMGRDDPLWAVLAWDGTEHGGWDLEAFFAEGERDVGAFLAEAAVLRASPHFGDALDFGCGVGRLSRALASRFESVTGVDISGPMIHQADRLVAAERSNCRFVLNTAATLPFPAASFDFVISNIVLQHMPPELAKGYIREFMRVLRPHGLAIFQVPDSCQWKSKKPVVGAVINSLPSRMREVVYRRRRRSDPRNLPMHCIPRNAVTTLVERNRGQLTACIEDVWGGPNWRSFHYIARRRG